MTDWAKLRVPELRAELKRRGLLPTGNKPDLVDRLHKDQEQITPTATGAEGDAEDEAESNANPGPNEDDVPVVHEAVPEPEAEPKPNPDPNPDRAPVPVPDVNDADPEAPVPEPKATVDKDDPTPECEPTVGPSPAEPEPALPNNLEPSVPDLNTNSGPVDPSAASAAPESDHATTSREPPAPSQADAPELARDAQKRKRRSATPPPSIHESKRVRTEGGMSPASDTAMDTDMNTANPIAEPDKDMQAPTTDLPSQSRDPMESQTQTDPPAQVTRQVAAAIHPPTSTLYIKNFMRPLRCDMLRSHLNDLAAAPGVEPDDQDVVDMWVDNIRSHAFVEFRTTGAAQRVRESLHDTIWPNESNRKALWVDFIPSNVMGEWSRREEVENKKKFEVLYDDSIVGDGVKARLAVLGSDARRLPVLAPAGSMQPPTGPRAHPGVQGAPLAPRADQQRGRGGFRQPHIDDPNVRSTRAHPMVYWKPLPDDLAQRRVDNMRTFYKVDARVSDEDRRNDINRYYFENGTNFVDRGKEIFAGIRPPHREREHRRLMREQRHRGSDSRLPEPDRRERPRLPAPQSFRPPRGDRYVGGAPARGDSYRDRGDVRGGGRGPRFEDRRFEGGRPGGGRGPSYSDFRDRRG